MAKIPVFVIHGFLESGKTQFAMETLSDEYFSDGERNLVIACEEGMEEYEDEVLQKSNTTLVMLEDKSEFNEMFLAECQKKYKPILTRNSLALICARTAAQAEWQKSKIH